MTPIQVALSVAAAIAVVALTALVIEKRKARRLRTKNQIASHTIATLAGLTNLIKVKAPSLAADPDVKRISVQALSIVNDHRERLVRPSPELDLLAKDLEELSGLEQRSSRHPYTDWPRNPRFAHG